MATAAPTIDQEIVASLKSRLSSIEGVVSFHFLNKEGLFSSWVGIDRYEKTVRDAIYDVEDEIAEKFPKVRFDFHILSIPEGRPVEDFISNANLGF